MQQPAAVLTGGVDHAFRRGRGGGEDVGGAAGGGGSAGGGRAHRVHR